MQCTTVLLLETTYQSREPSTVDSNILAAIKKMIRWLRAMEENDPIAAKALKVLQKLLRGVAPNLQAVARDLLVSDEDLIPLVHHVSPERPPRLPLSQPTEPSLPLELRTDPAILDEPGTTNPQAQRDTFGLSPDMNQIYSSHTQPLAMAFGNPFLTYFDQDMPFAVMEDPWVDSVNPGIFNPDWPVMDASLNRMNEDVDPNADYVPEEYHDIHNRPAGS